MKTYKIQDREAGNVIEKGLTYEEAQNLLMTFAIEDKENGVYVRDFYELVEEKIYRVILDLTGKDDLKPDWLTVYVTDDKEKVEEMLNKLSENKNLKYILK